MYRKHICVQVPQHGNFIPKKELKYTEHRSEEYYCRKTKQEVCPRDQIRWLIKKLIIMQLLIIIIIIIVACKSEDYLTQHCNKYLVN